MYKLRSIENSFNVLLQNNPLNHLEYDRDLIELPKNHIPLVIIAEVEAALKRIPDKSIAVIVTSPPYWNLRDYNSEHQIGLERSPDDYVRKISSLGKKMLRILKDDGAFFLNLGDTYIDGNLQMIPQRIAIEMQKHGWIIRNQIIWYKPNHMPSAVKNRFSNTYEVIYLFSKNTWQKRINFNLDEVRIAHKSKGTTQYVNRKYNGKFSNETKNIGSSPAGRIATSKDKYIKTRRIKASQHTIADFLGQALIDNNYTKGDLLKILGEKYRHTSSHWFRKDGGGSYPNIKDWVKLKRILKFGDEYDEQMTKEYKEIRCVRPHPNGKNPGDLLISPTAKSGYKHFAVFPDSIPTLAIKSCCPPDGVVLDPFAGSGTTGLIAKKLNRRSILIDIQESYIPIMKERIGEIKLL